MAIRFKRQTTKYNPKEHRIKENVKDFMYALDSAATKAVNSTGSFTNMAVAGQKSRFKSLQQFVENPVGKLKDDWSIISRGTFSNQKMYDDRKSQFEAGKITEEEFKRTEELYDIYSEYKAKDSMYKAKLLQSDKEYQQYVASRNIEMFSPKRVAMAVTREAASDLMNPYQLAIDYFGGKIGSLAVKGLSKYGKWARIGGELSVSAGVAGTANVVESYSYGKRSPSELGKDFALGATFGFMLSGGTKGMKALKTKALAKASGAIDNAADNALAARYDVTKMTPDEAADLVTKQVDDVSKFVTETATGKKFNEPNIHRFDDLRVQNELGNSVTYGTTTETILDGKYIPDSEIEKVVQYSYMPSKHYDNAKTIVQKYPEAIDRLNRYINDVPDNIKIMADLPDAEIAKIAPNLNGKEIRDIQNLKSQIIADFDQIDADMVASGMEGYSFFQFLDEEYKFSTSERVINVDQLGNIKEIKPEFRTDDIFNSNAYEIDDPIVRSTDEQNFNTLQRDMTEESINQRRIEAQNNINESIAAEENYLKQTEPNLVTAEQYEKMGNNVGNMTPEDRNLFKQYLENCSL